MEKKIAGLTFVGREEKRKLSEKGQREGKETKN